MSPLILSLCDLTGNWSRPYEEAGYKVIRWDLVDGHDIRLEELPTEPVHGILAAPPCTCFCRLGAATKRTPEEMAAALAVVDACLRFVAILRPQWWALENPPGKLTRWLGPPVYKFQPSDFGDPWTKLTYLWGSFTAPSYAITPHIKPVIPELGTCRTTKLSNRVERSATPMGFARAFFGANP